MSKGYEVVVRGEYVARSGVMGKERVIKEYEITCIVPNLEKPLSVIKNKILGKKLKAMYPGYVLFRTHHIMMITPLSEEDKFNSDLENIRYMSRESLLRFTKRNALGVPTNLYPDLFKLREAVQFASNDPEGYEKHLDIHREDLELDREVASLNPDLQEKETNEAPLEEVLVPKAPKRVRKKKNISKGQIAKQTEERIGGLGADMKKEGEMGDMDDATETAIEDL